MKLIDRYIARQYAINLAALLAILFSFVVTIDASINIDEFWRAAGESATTSPDDEPGLVRQVTLTALWIAHLWWPRLLQLFNMMLGVILVGGMGFTCVQLVRHRETVAVLASGMSLRRIAAPIVAVSLLMVGAAAVNQELVLPRVAKLLTREHSDLGTRQAAAGPIPLATGNQGRLLLYAREFSAGEMALHGFLFIERDDQGVGLRHITGERATWTGDAWACDDASVEDLTEAANSAAGIPVQIKSDLDPTALTVLQFAGFGQNLSFNQIGRLLQQTKGGDAAIRERLQRNRFGRISLAICNILTIVIALPFFLTRMPGNSLGGSLRGAPVAIIAIIGATLGASAPVPGVPAVVSVFVPVLVLAPLAIAISLNPRT